MLECSAVRPSPEEPSLDESTELNRGQKGPLGTLQKYYNNLLSHCQPLHSKILGVNLQSQNVQNVTEWTCEGPFGYICKLQIDTEDFTVLSASTPIIP